MEQLEHLSNCHPAIFGVCLMLTPIAKKQLIVIGNLSLELKELDLEKNEFVISSTKYFVVLRDTNWVVAVSAQRSQHVYISDTPIGTLLVFWKNNSLFETNSEILKHALQTTLMFCNM